MSMEAAFDVPGWDEVQEQVAQQLLATGRFTQEAARANAALYRFFWVQAQRLGEGFDARALFDRYGLKVEARKHPEPLPEALEVDGVLRPTRNSEGRPIALDPESVRNFWRWYGADSALDEQGRPRVFYHGTTGDVESFELGYAGADGVLYGQPAVFATPDKALANDYAVSKLDREISDAMRALQRHKNEFPGVYDERYETRYAAVKAAFRRVQQQGRGEAGGGANVLPVYVRGRLLAADGEGHYFSAVIPKALAAAAAQGADGVVVDNVIDHASPASKYPSQVVAVFDGRNLKSALGNRGTFDPASPRILHQFAGPTARTAPLEQLAEARRRVEAGEDGEVVRKETGWHQGVDGQWRFEISDEGARLKLWGMPAFEALRVANGGEWITASDFEKRHPEHELAQQIRTWSLARQRRTLTRESGVLTLGDVLDHPRLFEAYPWMAEGVELRVDDEIPIGNGRLHVEGTYRVIVMGPAPREEALRVIQHEVQHVIQHVEGFAHGGSERTLEFLVDDSETRLNDLSWGVEMLIDERWGVVQEIRASLTEKEKASILARQDVADILHEYKGQEDRLWHDICSRIGEYLPAPGRWPQNLLEELASLNRDIEACWKESRKEEARIDRLRGHGPDGTYRRLAGEVEARNTETRMDLTTAQRRAIPPAATASVPEEEQVIAYSGRWSSGDGGAAARMTALPEQLEVDGVLRPSRNSRGQSIAASVEALRNFWRWFGDSVAVDAQGRPLVLYHGTDTGGFHTFSASRGVKVEGVFFFTTNRRLAQTYAKRPGDAEITEDEDGYFDSSPGIYEVYLRVQQPWESDFEGAYWSGQRESPIYELLDGDEDLIDTVDTPEEAEEAVDEGRASTYRAQEWMGTSTDCEVRDARRYGRDGALLRRVRDPGPYSTCSDEEGDIFVVFAPGQIKSVHNLGAFSPSEDNILRQVALRPSPDAQTAAALARWRSRQARRQAEPVERGRIDLAARRITLFEFADASTFAHETAHFFLEVYADLAETPQAPAEVREDWAEILRWLGVEHRGQIRAQHHEQWARGFEQYLAEGRAPVPGLARVFGMFRDWMRDVYGLLAGQREKLAPEIRGVMDRMLGPQDFGVPAEGEEEPGPERLRGWGVG